MRREGVYMINFIIKKTLILQIELKRKSMYKKANLLGFTHPDVVNFSQELDLLLNKYSKIV